MVGKKKNHLDFASDKDNHLGGKKMSCYMFLSSGI